MSVVKLSPSRSAEGDLFDRYLDHQLGAVDWVPFSGPICCFRDGPYITHMGYAFVGPLELMVYKLSSGEPVFDAECFMRQAYANG